MKKTKSKYIQDICEVVSSKSTCDRAHVGAVIINEDFEILATGYNGAPRGLYDCYEVGHEHKEDGGCQRTVHAEMNAIVQAAKRGTSINGAIMLVTMSPCYECTKIIINSGISRVYYRELYRKSEHLTKFDQVGIRHGDWNDMVHELC